MTLLAWLQAFMCLRFDAPQRRITVLPREKGEMTITRRACLISSVAGFPALHLGRASATSVTAEIQSGRVRGADANGVAVFRGIPYAGPTEGTARFLPPSRPQKWSGVRDATVTGPRCVQNPGNIFLNPRIGEYFGGGRPDRVELAQQVDSENCLALNVLTPGLRGKRPVMVYMHGGGFTGGSSLLTLYSDRHVGEQDIVLVGVNHRLNVFGYMYLGGLSDKYSVGNAGQLDLIAALEWVRDNITNFGGDPNNVTIFGESGGGGKVSTLMAMPGAKGLFHKACVQSGSMLRVLDADAATKHAKGLMSKLGINKVEELLNVPAVDLLKAASGPGAVGSSPVVDGRSLPHQTWDPKAPAISAGIPMIIGTCKDESSLFVLSNESLYSLDEAGLRDALVKSGLPEPTVDGLVAKYHRDHPKESPSDLYFRISTDRGPRRNAVKQAELQLVNGNASVYIYHFQWNTPLVDGKVRAFHTADLPLEMRLVRFPESEQLSRQLSGAWAAFARSGNPSQKGLSWPAYTTSDRATMMFDALGTGAVNDPDRDERIMLKELPGG
jgi:para-nitrobenzyl esterase